MLDHVAPTLQTGARMVIETVEAEGLPEGIYADGLAQVAAAHPDVSIGSYPSFSSSGFRNHIVVRGKDPARVAAAMEAVKLLLGRLKGDRVPA
jgi:molybdopterin-biosynthesis enzyme MoeA-like protein